MVVVSAGPAWAAAPSQPAQPSIVPLNGQMLVLFTAPADGGSPITGYTANCVSSDGGAPGTAGGTSLAITVGGLTNGKTYTCTVSATNGDGTSPDSVASAPAVPATVPDAPPQPTVLALNAAIVVSFSVPFDGGSPITGYTATCTSSDGGAPGSAPGSSSPITVGSLSNGNTYTCTATASNVNGASAPSVASLSAVPNTVPDAPATPTVVAGNASVSVSFVAPFDGGSPISSYTASCTSSDGGASGASGGSSSPIVVVGLTSGNTYTCTVLATNVNGPGPASPESLPVVPGSVPAPPATPTVASGNTSITVTFTPPFDGGSPITGYTAICTSSDGGVPGTTGGAASPIVVTGLSNGNTYTCVVLASNVNGAGGASPSSLPAVPGAAPDPPAQPTLATGDGGIDVSFTAPFDGGFPISGYKVVCSSNDGGLPGFAAGAATTIDVTGVTVGKTYTCTVAATNINGDSDPSVDSLPIVVSSGTVPDAPAKPTVVAGNARVTVSFVAPANGGSPITSYTATCTSGVASRSLTGFASPIAVTPLANGKAYTCTVLARNVNGPGPASPPSAAAIPKSAPSRPAVPAVTSGNSRLSVAFTAPFNGGAPITSYRVHCASSNGGGAGTQTGTRSPIVVTRLVNGYSYVCSVAAFNALGSSPTSAPSVARVPFGRGFRMFSGDGGVYVFGQAGYYGSAASPSLVIAMMTTRDDRGYWLVNQAGDVFTFGDARSFGSLHGRHLNQPIVGAAPSPTGRGYWLVASDGGIFSFGDARFYGSTGNIRLNKPIVAMTPTASGHGYWFVADDGGLFAFGDARFFGSAAGRGATVVGMATSGTGRGYWIAASNGQVFGFGDARVGRHGPLPNLRLPIMGIAATETGNGYWMAAADGGLFTAGDAPYIGWSRAIVLRRYIRGVAR